MNGRDPCKMYQYVFNRREHDVTIYALPSALGDLKMCCDTCAKKKGEMFMTASVYCVPCGMKYCSDHHKVS